MTAARKHPRTPHPTPPDELPAELRLAFWDLCTIRAYRGGKAFARTDVEYSPALMQRLVEHGLVDEMGTSHCHADGRADAGAERLYILRPAAVLAAADLGWIKL